jgi:DNA-binding NtrC family response regulator
LNVKRAHADAARISDAERSSSKSPRAGSHADPEGGFAALDDVVSDAQAHGSLTVTVSPTTRVALARHLTRRLNQVGREAHVIGLAPCADPWRELARSLDAVDTDEPMALATDIAAALGGAAAIVASDATSDWGTDVERELRRLAGDADRAILVLVLRSPREVAPSHVDLAALSALSSAPHTTGAAAASGVTIGPLGAEDRRRWWDAIVAQDRFVRGEGDGAGLDDLASIDGWWQSVKGAPQLTPQELGERNAAALSDTAARLLDYLVEAQQALDDAQVAALATTEARSELLDAGLARRNAAGHMVASAVATATAGATAGDTAPSGDDTTRRRLDAQALRRLAGELARPRGADGWSLMRAAELRAAAGDREHAEALTFEAVRRVKDPRARDDLWGRWEQLLANVDEGEDARLARLLRSAEHALALGDGERGDLLARRAMTIDGDCFEVLLLHGRACCARGDLTTATLSLNRALQAAGDDATRAKAAGEIAQVRHLAGTPDQAESYAQEAVTLADDTATRLAGRNVLGKLLLMREAWGEAEEHFAADAYEAARAGLHEDELRARLNRAIAVLYLARRDQARGMLEAVLADAQRHGLLQAVTYSLSNLATIAILQHQFERALELSERAIAVRRQIGSRIGLVQPITNLAELRLNLGLLDEAEEGLRFGLHSCGQGLPLSRYAYFAKAAARIHLARGDSQLATKELSSALSGASCSGELALLAQCHRIATRIALEDGDVPRAEASLAMALELRHTAHGRAELAVLAAMVDRAAGRDFATAAHEALGLAQAADDPESLREAFLLLRHAAAQQGDSTAADSHLRSAVAQRDRVADSLPKSIRQRFLARRALAELDVIELGMFGQCELDVEGPVTERAPRAVVRSSEPERVLVGDSAAMRGLRGTIKRVAATSAPVLVHGETGTGKELVAEAIHRASHRAGGPLVKVNCAALVETLLLSELFGHEKGAFTGASARRRGRFELADGGTLFLDEIGDISPRTQVALLRVLQEGTFERVGGTTQLRTDVRIVCASHRDLRAMVERGEFREDLYYRLCGVLLEVPPLRDRTADLPLLAQTLLRRAEKTSGVRPLPLSQEAKGALSQHSWPGNVRELENALRVAALFARAETIELSDFTDNVESLRHLSDGPLSNDRPASAAAANGPASLPSGAAGRDGGGGPRESLPPPSSSSDLVYAEVRSGMRLADMKKRLERECISRALVESGGNITRAASLLGMKRPRLSQLVKQYSLASVLEDSKS